MDKRRTTPDSNDQPQVPDTFEGKAVLPDAPSVEDAAIEPIRDPATEISGNQVSGQTSRGSYGTDSATGAGTYMDHNGTFATLPVDQTGVDDVEVPDAQDTAE